MQELFPAMMQSLSAAVDKISNVYFRVPKDKSEEAADTMEQLHTALIQLNTVLFFEYAFEEGFLADVIHYTGLLKEYETACAEKIQYMLDRPSMFGSDSYTNYQAAFLEEVLQRIIIYSNMISNISN